VQAKQQLATKSYEQAFEEDYAHLKNLALRVTDNNHELSQDLLHDLYLRLSQREAAERPENLMAYLFIALRNSYQSVIRKKKLEETFASYDEDVFSNTLFDEKILNLHKIEDQLRAVCRYACLRKETSISGSVIILRYFHGYYTSEVSRIVRRSRNAVEARLVTARREIDQYLTNPNSVPFSVRARYPQKPAPGRSKNAGDLLTELRRQIFSTRPGACLSAAEYRFVFRLSKKPPNHKILSHVVSCPQCLEKVNRLLKLPALKDRHPLDSVRESPLGFLLLIYLLIEPMLVQLLLRSPEIAAFSELL
jgi:DNA-directed RNA polymerase specialized sigma24 family protein